MFVSQLKFFIQKILSLSQDTTKLVHQNKLQDTTNYINGPARFLLFLNKNRVLNFRLLLYVFELYFIYF